MAKNIEIKARIADLASIRTKAAALALGPPQVLHQTDTFFVVPEGRLKVRAFLDGSGELISYERANQQVRKNRSIRWPLARTLTRSRQHWAACCRFAGLSRSAGKSFSLAEHGCTSTRSSISGVSSNWKWCWNQTNLLNKVTVKLVNSLWRCRFLSGRW